jgi:hypothetical protein
MAAITSAAVARSFANRISMICRSLRLRLRCDFTMR